MAQQIVNLGTLADGSDGDTNKVAWGKAKDNFAELYEAAAGVQNKIINGAFNVNHREYVSGAATTSANQYTYDRWRVVTSGQSLAVSSGVATAPSGGLEQVIEGAAIEGGVYSVAWDGTATATVNGAAVSNGGQTASLTAGANVTLRFVSGTVANVRFVLGSMAPIFVARHYAEEALLCRRYYQRFGDTGTRSTLCMGQGAGAGVGLCSLSFPPMRAAPTISFDFASVTRAGTAQTITSQTVASATKTDVKFTIAASSITAGDCLIVESRRDSGRGVELSAEL